MHRTDTTPFILIFTTGKVGSKMIQYTIEESLWNFRAWSGGLTNLEELKSHSDAFNYIEVFLEEWCSCDNVTDTQINDFLWFEMYDRLEEAEFVDEDHEWIEED